MPDGQRVQRSTKETKRKLAQEKANEYEEMSKQRAKARQSHRIIREIYERAHKETLPDATVKSFVQSWLLRRKGELAASTYSAYDGRSSHFLKWLGSGAESALFELSKAHFIRYRDDLAKSASTSTTNHAIKLLRVIFEDARREEKISDNPAADCPRLKPTKGEDKGVNARRPFTVEELQKVLTVASDDWKTMVLLGIYTGQRLSDLAGLKWSDIRNDELQLVTAKTGVRVIIPLASPLKRHLDGMKRPADPRSPILPGLAAHVLAGGRTPTLSNKFGSILAKAGLRSKVSHRRKKADDETASSRKRIVNELTFHSLRHTAVSMMKNAGANSAIVQDLVGHESAEISAHYTRVTSKAKMEALNLIPDFQPTTLQDEIRG